MIIECDCIEGMGTLASGSVDLIVTDPPYGDNFKSGRQTIDRKTGERREAYFDSIVGDDRLPTAWLPEAYRTLKDGGAAYIFCRWTRWPELAFAVGSSGFTIKNMLVMNKSNHGMGDLKGAFAPKHELVMFATKGRHLLRFPPRLKDVWDVPVIFTGAHRKHPNEKPLSWLKPMIKASSDPGDLVLDPFCGSGSTCLAAKEEGRKSLGFEVDPIWANTAVQRMGDQPSVAKESA